MKQKKPVITGSIDKDQLSYESNFNPKNVNYVGPRIAGNHDIIVSASSSEVEDLQ